MQPTKKYLYGGLNADDDFEFVDEKQWVNASGIRIMSTDKGASMRVESIGGTQVLFNDLPVGTNFCMGGCVDEETNLLFYFNANSGNENGIYAYNRILGVGYKVLLNSQTGNSLAITKDTYIHSVEAVNGLLYWVDSNKVLCKINFKAGINLNHPGTFPGVTAYPNPITEAEIRVIKNPPLKRPGALGAVASPAISYNLIVKGIFRFAWRFKYRDNEVSTLSDFSEVVNMRADTTGLGYNSINVFAGGGGLATIPSEVQAVDLVVQYMLTDKVSVIRTWDKDIAADAAAIIASNAGTPLSYNFKNNEAGETLAPAYIIKHQEDVPINVETLALARNRVFVANFRNGYNSPKLTSLAVGTQVVTAIPTLGNPVQVFKSEGSRQTGMVFYDKYFRRCGVVKGPQFTIPDMQYFTTTQDKITLVPLSVSNTAALLEIPDWAYYYRPCVTQVDTTDSFFQGHFSAGLFKYVYKDEITGVLTYADTLATTPYGLAVSIAEVLPSGIGYSFTEGSGDTMKIYLSNTVVYKKQVIAADESYVIVPWDGSIVTALNTLQGVFEIFNPRSILTQEVFYEVGELNVVNNPTTNTRSYATTSFAVTGDVWMIQRQLTPALRMRFEAMSALDEFWTQWVKDQGRPNFIDNIGQVQITTGIKFSNVIVPGTKVNGLGSFEVLNEEILDVEKGPIRKLQLANKVQQDGSVMLAIHENSTSSIYLGQQEIFDSQGSAFVSKSNNVIGSINDLRGGYGTINPESVFEYNGLVYWWDLRNGAVIQYSNSGLFPITQNKFTRPANLISKKYQSLTSAQIEAFGSRPFIVGGFDPVHKEIVFSIPQTETTPPKGNLIDYSSPSIPYPYDIYDGKAKTLIYKADGDAWCGDIPVQAEKFLRLGNDFYSFKSGILYKHNTDSHGLFYGVQYKSKISFVVNVPAIATFYSMGIEGNLIPTFTHFRTDDPYEQSSDLLASNFETKEGIHYANLKRDRLSPNKPGTYLLKQMNGDRMFGGYLLTYFEFDVSATPLALKFVTTGFNINKGHLQLK